MNLSLVFHFLAAPQLTEGIMFDVLSSFHFFFGSNKTYVYEGDNSPDIGDGGESQASQSSTRSGKLSSMTVCSKGVRWHYCMWFLLHLYRYASMGLPVLGYSWTFLSLLHINLLYAIGVLLLKYTMILHLQHDVPLLQVMHLTCGAL
jgi:hypothetical protein